MFKGWLEDLLHEGVVEIVFTKTDGSSRIIRATKKQSLINMEAAGGGAATLFSAGGTRRKSIVNPESKKENIIVWDTDQQGWRTVKVKKIENLITIILKYDYQTSPLKIFDGWPEL